MLTSTQIAAMMAQQNQMFMGAAGYAQQISAQMPPVMQGAGTIGSYGMQRGPQFPNVPFLPGHQAGFNYGGGGAMGYGPSNRMGGMAVSAMGGAAQLGIGAAGLFGGAMFDPLAGGMAGFGAARAAGMGIGGALGVGAMAALPATAMGMFASHTVSSMVGGAQEQSAVNTSLGQHNFINPMSRSGRGFSRSDAMAIGGMMREMQAIPEMMTSMSELTRIMDKVGQMGVMQGARDASEFKKRFKETVDTLKTVAQVMGTSMEEALPVFQQSKMMGFHSKGAIVQNAINSQITGGLTGMSNQQVAALQMQGSQLSFAMGGSRAGGARGVARVARELGTANQLGLLTNDRIMEMTGMEGGEGIQALSNTINEAGYKMAGSSLGNAMTLALGEVKDGRYTGQMDADLVRRVRSGQIGKGELLHIARQKSSSRTAKISFKAHQRGLRTEMVNQTGVQGIMMELQTILGERGWDNPDALNLVMQRYGLDEREASQVIELGKEMPKIEQEMMGSSETEVRRIANQSYMAQHASWDGVKRKIGKKISNVLTEPFKRLGASIGNSISESIDNFVDDIFGRYHTDVSKNVGDLVSASKMGGADAGKKLSALVASSGFGSISKQGADLRGSSTMNALNYLSGTDNLGEQQANLLGGMGGGRFLSRTGSSGADRLTDDAWTSPQQRQDAGRYLDQLRKGGGDISKSLESSPEFAQAAQQLRGVLKRSDLMSDEMTDSEKMRILTSQMTAAGGGSAFQKLRDLHGGGEEYDIDIISALGRKGGTSSWKGMPNAKSMQALLSGGLDPGALPDVARQNRDLLKDIKGAFGSEGSAVASMLSSGGGMGNVIGALFNRTTKQEGGQAYVSKSRLAQQQALEGLIMGSAPLDKKGKELLHSLGVTEEEFLKNQDTLRSIVAAGGGMSEENKAKIEKLIGGKALESLLGIQGQRAKLGQSISDRMETFAEEDKTLMAKGSKGARSALGHLKAYAAELQDPNSLLSGGAGVDTGNLIEEVSGLKGKERDLVERQLSGSLQAGMMAYGAAGRRYKNQRRKHGGKVSLEDMGFSEDSLMAQGAGPEMVKELMSKAKGIAGGDGNALVSDKEAKQLAKLLGSSTEKGALHAPGASMGTSAPVAKMEEAFKKLSDNMDKSATLLDALTNKTGITADDVTKKTS